jgi:hypothetical protein
MISLNEIYRMLCGVVLLAMVFCILLPRAQGRAPSGAH